MTCYLEKFEKLYIWLYFMCLQLVNIHDSDKLNRLLDDLSAYHRLYAVLQHWLGFRYSTWWIVTPRILTLLYKLAAIISGSVSIRWRYNWSQDNKRIILFGSVFISEVFSSILLLIVKKIKSRIRNHTALPF